MMGMITFDVITKYQCSYEQDTGAVVKNLIFGASAHILNVTSQQWLDTTKAAGPNGHIVLKFEIFLLLVYC